MESFYAGEWKLVFSIIYSTHSSPMKDEAQGIEVNKRPLGCPVRDKWLNMSKTELLISSPLDSSTNPSPEPSPPWLVGADHPSSHSSTPHFLSLPTSSPSASALVGSISDLLWESSDFSPLPQLRLCYKPVSSRAWNTAIES